MRTKRVGEIDPWCAGKYRETFAITEPSIISELISNFDNPIIPISLKLWNTELAAFPRALPGTAQCQVI